jgi:mono/diheme cytochrome c family protein
MLTTLASRLTLAALAAAVLMPAAAQAAPITPKIFTEKNCTQCHKVSAYGIEGGETGPDLSIAWTDVQDRFGVPLDKFMKSPTGTMQVVLGSMIKLTPAERDGIVKLLKEAHQKKAKKK